MPGGQHADRDRVDDVAVPGPGQEVEARNRPGDARSRDEGVALRGRLQVALGRGLQRAGEFRHLRERIRIEADNAGYFVRIGSMGPGFFSVRASDVKISKKSDADPPPEAMQIDSLSIGPSLMPLGVKVKAGVLGGTIAAKVGALGATRVVVDAERFMSRL